MECFIIFLFLGFIVFNILSHLNNQTRSWWAPWQKLAEANDLSFSPGDFFGKTRIFGKYGRHHLTLITTHEAPGSHDGAETRLTVFANSHVHHGISLSNGCLPEAPLSIEDVVHLFTLDKLGHNIWGKVKAAASGRKISYKQVDTETNTKYLQFLFDWLSDIADAYPAIVALGGEGVPSLCSLTEQNSRLEPLITQLLHDIANETKTRLGHRATDLVCPRCLTTCGEHKVKLSWWQSITYYGCRTCHQSREFFEGWVIALLDNQTDQEQVQRNGVMRVNWLSRRAVFDFDEVEIVKATDEDVERFAVQVGNDTDPLRKSRYQQMRCVVLAECSLSENTHRILQRMFGSVELRGVEFIREIADIHERTANDRNGILKQDFEQSP